MLLQHLFEHFEFVLRLLLVSAKVCDCRFFVIKLLLFSLLKGYSTHNALSGKSRRRST